jgi:PAP2 superfamily
VQHVLIRILTFRCVPGEDKISRGSRSLASVSRTRLAVISLVSLLATALLGLAVSRGFNALRLERHALHLLGHRNIDHYADMADFLAVPVIAAVLIASTLYGALRRVVVRVVVLAGFALLALVLNEQVLKPVVQQRFQGGLSFPSGNVTAVCATAVAMWIALYPVLGREARFATFLFGAAWTFLMSLAVVGAFWHTPLDVIGSILLSVGVVTGGATLFRSRSTPRPASPVDPPRVLERV